MKIGKVYDSYYRIQTLYVTDCKLIDFVKKHKRQLDETSMNVLMEVIQRDPAGFHSVFHTDCGDLYFIWIYNHKDFSVMTHEIHHMICSIFEDRDVPVGINNQEAFAYYMSFWISKFIEIGKKRK